MRRLKRNNRFLNNNAWARRGATAVEFAIVAPAFFVMILICAEFARMMMLRDLAHHAAYEAARTVIVEGASNQDALDEANRILARLGCEGSSVDINNGGTIDFSTESVTVTVVIPMADNAFMFASRYGDNSIEAQITLSTERYTGYFNADEIN